MRRIAALGLVFVAACSAQDPSVAVHPAASGGPLSTTKPASARPTTPGPTAAVPSPTQSAGELSCARSALSKLSAAERVGQLFMVGVNPDQYGTARTLVRQGRVGGIFLRGRTSRGMALAPTLAQLQAIARAQKLPGIHIAADEEGGEIQSVTGPGIPAWPSARAQSRWTAADLATRSVPWARSLRALGLTMDLAPVADVVALKDRETNKAIGAKEREYGHEPDGAAKRVAVVTKALEDAGISATAKHFPGLGRVSSNTDTTKGAADGLTTSFDPNLQPFKAAIGAGTSAVMISSATYSLLDADNPAMWSRAVITGLLRQKLGFRGLVLSDDIGEAIAVQDVPAGQRAVRFLAAGGDLVLIVSPKPLGDMVAAVRQAARANPAFFARVREAELHVMTNKVRAGLVRC